MEKQALVLLLYSPLLLREKTYSPYNRQVEKTVILKTPMQSNSAVVRVQYNL